MTTDFDAGLLAASLVEMAAFWWRLFLQDHRRLLLDDRAGFVRGGIKAVVIKLII